MTDGSAARPPRCCREPNPLSPHLAAGQNIHIDVFFKSFETPQLACTMHCSLLRRVRDRPLERLLDGGARCRYSQCRASANKEILVDLNRRTLDHCVHIIRLYAHTAFSFAVSLPKALLQLVQRRRPRIQLLKRNRRQRNLDGVVQLMHVVDRLVDVQEARHDLAHGRSLM